MFGFAINVGTGVDDHRALAQARNNDQNRRPRHLRKLPMTNMPSAIIAPEFPALTTASASPRFIISKATLIDESFLRSATLGDSCIGTT